MMEEKEGALRARGQALLDLLDAQQLRMAVDFLSRLAQGHARDWGPLGTILGVQQHHRRWHFGDPA